MHLTSLSTVKLSCFAWPHEMKAILQSPMQGQPKRFLVFLRLTSRLLSLEVEASLRSEVSQKQSSFPGLKRLVEAYAKYELSFKQLFGWELMTSQYRTSALTSLPADVLWGSFVTHSFLCVDKLFFKTSIFVL